MSKLRWAKLWWSDWENDPALRLCSLAAQGLWMRLLCLAANADPYGHVLVAGKPPTIAQIARIVGAQGSQVRLLVTELERNGVLSRSDRGAIVSRRMVRDGAEHAIKSQAGSLGGNPALNRVKNPEPPNGNGMDKQADKQVLNVEEEEEDKVRFNRNPPYAPPRKGGPRGRGSSKLSPQTKDHFTAIAADMLAEPDDDTDRVVRLRVGGHR
jgi:hypothetical protein